MVERETMTSQLWMVDQHEEIATLKAYLEALMTAFHVPLITHDQGLNAEEVPARVFEVLTNREFCYLSKTRVSGYQESVLTAANWAVRQGEPIHFSYDLGGGYHASTHPGEEEVSFDVGLAELFVLRQISSFSTRVRRFYPAGVRFSLVIDNMCALLINDTPLVKTLGYCARLRTLIHELGLGDVLDVLVESEHVSLADFDRARAGALGRNGSMTLTKKQHDNVERFLGRRCDGIEAFGRTARYHEVMDASERLVAPLIRGVHMTQRATDTTICFRPFPGGDSRIQCGEVVLTRSTTQKLYPVLLTSSNRGQYACRRYQFPELLSSLIHHVSYAEPLPG
jgi:hypothetical protein